MFGYVKPVRCKLSDDDWQQYRAAYCGLCHVLGKRYGFRARFIVNYDFTFLSLLLFSLQVEDACLQTQYCRCIASPLRKKRVCLSHRSFEYAADAAIVLFWWQLQDKIVDQKFFTAIPYRMLSISFQSAYQKASARVPEFAHQVESCICELQRLENARVDSIDRPADTFARILENLSVILKDRKDSESLKCLLYHLGRFIYILDAWDDVCEDFCAQRYNPIVERFELDSKVIPKEVQSELEQTLCHSISEIGRAFEDFQTSTLLRPLLNNIINFGLFSVMHQVASGENTKKEKRLHE